MTTTGPGRDATNRADCARHPDLSDTRRWKLAGQSLYDARRTEESPGSKEQDAG